MITVKDIARHAGVSPGTVSNVLTGKRPVSSLTRQRVLQAIDELGYSPNELARSLVNRRSETLAVVASRLEYYGPSRLIAGVEHAAERLGYSLLLALLPDSEPAHVDALLSSLVARRVDGIVWAVPEDADNRAEVSAALLSSGPPLIYLGMGSRADLPVVAVDNHLGGALAARHLLDLGRRSLGIISGPTSWWEARARCAGFFEVVERAGPPALPIVYEGDWSAAGGSAGARALLAQQPGLDCIFACNDQMALGVLLAAHALGRRVPDDLAVVGFDNTPESAYFWPPLTTIYQHLTDVGRIAVEELHEMVQAGLDGHPRDPAAPILLAPELIVRESSGRPAS